MVVAVIAVGVVQVAGDQIVDVVPVRHRRVAAAGAVLVVRGVAAAGVIGRAAVRVLIADGNHVLVDVITVGVMQVAIMQIVDVVLVLDGDMPAVRPMLMIVVFVSLAGHLVLLGNANSTYDKLMKCSRVDTPINAAALGLPHADRPRGQIPGRTPRRLRTPPRNNDPPEEFSTMSKRSLAALVLFTFLAQPAVADAWPSIKSLKKRVSSGSSKRKVKSLSPEQIERERINKSPAAMEIRSLRSMCKSFKKKLQKDKSWWANTHKNQYWIKSDLKRGKKYLARIKSKDPSYSTKDFEQTFAKVEARLGTAVAAGSAKKAHTSSLRSSAMAFKKELKTFGAVLRLIHKIEQGSAKPDPYVKRVLAVGKQLAGVDGFFTRCKSTYSKAMVDQDPNGRIYWRTIDKSSRDLCKLDGAASIKKVLAWVEKSAAKADKDSEKAARHYLKDLAEKGTYSNWAVSHFAKIDEEVKKDRERWQPVYATILKKAMPANLFKGQATYFRANYKKSLKQGLKLHRFGRKQFKGRNRDGRSTAAVKREFKAAKMRVLKAHQTGGWTMKKNAIGIPLYRYIGTRVLVRAKGERHCRIYEVTTRQQYAGGGRWARGRSVSSSIKGRFWVARCR